MIKPVTKSLSKKPSKNLELELTIPLSTLKQPQQCNNIANYFSSYLTASYTHHKQQSFYTYSTIFFELIENAMRFSQKDNDSISIDLKKKNNNISILVTNYTNNYHSNRFQHCLTKIKKESTLERLLLHCIQNQETKLLCWHLRTLGMPIITLEAEATISTHLNFLWFLKIT